MILSICKKEVDPDSQPNLRKLRSPNDSRVRHRCCSSASFVSRQFTKTLAVIKYGTIYERMEPKVQNEEKSKKTKQRKSDKHRQSNQGNTEEQLQKENTRVADLRLHFKES